MKFPHKYTHKYRYIYGGIRPLEAYGLSRRSQKMTTTRYYNLVSKRTIPGETTPTGIRYYDLEGNYFLQGWKTPEYLQYRLIEEGTTAAVVRSINYWADGPSVSVKASNWVKITNEDAQKGIFICLGIKSYREWRKDRPSILTDAGEEFPITLRGYHGGNLCGHAGVAAFVPYGTNFTAHFHRWEYLLRGSLTKNDICVKTVPLREPCEI